MNEKKLDKFNSIMKYPNIIGMALVMAIQLLNINDINIVKHIVSLNVEFLFIINTKKLNKY